MATRTLVANTLLPSLSRTHTHTHACTCMHAPTHTHTCTHTLSLMLVCMHSHTHAHTLSLTRLYTHTHTHTCTPATHILSAAFSLSLFLSGNQSNRITASMSDPSVIFFPPVSTALPVKYQKLPVNANPGGFPWREIGMRTFGLADVIVCVLEKILQYCWKWCCNAISTHKIICAKNKNFGYNLLYIE